MTIQELLTKISETPQQELKLFFVTRHLKENVRKSSKVLDKYLFKVYQIDINDEIREYLYNLTIEQLKSIIRKNYEIMDYEVVGDDIETLWTYSMKNKLLSFSDVVSNQLKKMPPVVIEFEELYENNQELWAYCIGCYDIKSRDWIYAFRKIQVSKVVVDQRKSKSLQTHFNTISKKLEMLKGITINLDKQIDCIYYADIFYILRKFDFEQIVGLREEYKQAAKEVVSLLEQTNLITGTHLINEIIENTPSIHKKLVRISKVCNINTLSPKDIRKMKTVSKKYGETLTIKDDKINISNEKDVDVVLKMLADYYKVGEVFGKNYGTFAGKVLQQKV